MRTSKTQHMGQNYYTLLGISPWSTARQIRQAYRELSKLYHPDTTVLDSAQAIAKFQDLNQAYATLSNPERRAAYDQLIQFSRFTYTPPATTTWQTDDGLPIQRPLSGGEVFSLAILLLTLITCLAIAITIGLMRGDQLLPQ
ncbi:MAG: J domain-containing protein [Pseudanabaenaceae cyanobacterium bins.68]|nr:J domain-containing protein [Pseudanabaenaceae cyanobacterium bins.68]